MRQNGNSPACAGKIYGTKGNCDHVGREKRGGILYHLREELQLATGCTEPIAVAYCAARLRQVLGQRPCRILAEVSGNILKNVKSVVVPNTGGRRGLPAAIAVGMVAGDPEAGSRSSPM